MEISHILKHNFFSDIAALLPAEYSTDVPADTSQAEKIAELQNEVLKRSSERDVLLKLNGK